MNMQLRLSEKTIIAPSRLGSVVPNFREKDHGTINYDTKYGNGVLLNLHNKFINKS